MKKMLSTLALLLIGATLVGCDLDKLTGNDGEEPFPLIRYLRFKFVEIPSTMSNEAALLLMRSEANSALRAGATEHWFPTADSLTNPWGGQKVSVNRVIVTPAGSSHSGGTRLLGGQDADVHPFQPGLPSALTIDAAGVETVGETGTLGSFELRFNEDELVVGGDQFSGRMDFTLASLDQQTTYATGKFLFIAHNLNDRSDTRRWAIFDGEFALGVPRL